MESTNFDDTTEALPNGANLPEHPALTTSKKITEYGRVWDDADGVTLHGGLHEAEIRNLMNGDQMALKHLYRFAIRNKRIFHTRNLVCIDVKTENVDTAD
jgi:hypothetical protein